MYDFYVSTNSPWKQAECCWGSLVFLSLFLLYGDFLNKVYLITLLPYLDMHTKIRLETNLIKIKQFLG